MGFPKIKTEKTEFPKIKTEKTEFGKKWNGIWPVKIYRVQHYQV